MRRAKVADAAVRREPGPGAAGLVPDARPAGLADAAVRRAKVADAAVRREPGPGARPGPLVPAKSWAGQGAQRAADSPPPRRRQRRRRRARMATTAEATARAAAGAAQRRGAEDATVWGAGTGA